MVGYCKVTDFPALKMYELGSEVQSIDDANLDRLNVELNTVSKATQQEERKPDVRISTENR